MTKPISRRAHGFVDYNYIALVSAAPKLFGFEGDKKAETMCQVQSGAVLLSSFFTRAEWGFVRVMPFRVHLLIDAIASVLALGAPWLFGFSGNARARNAFLAFGMIGLLVGAVTRPDEMG